MRETTNRKTRSSYYRPKSKILLFEENGLKVYSVLHTSSLLVNSGHIQKISRVYVSRAIRRVVNFSWNSLNKSSSDTVIFHFRAFQSSIVFTPLLAITNDSPFAAFRPERSMLVHTEKAVHRVNHLGRFSILLRQVACSQSHLFFFWNNRRIGCLAMVMSVACRTNQSNVTNGLIGKRAGRTEVENIQKITVLASIAKSPTIIYWCLGAYQISLLHLVTFEAFLYIRRDNHAGRATVVLICRYIELSWPIDSCIAELGHSW